MIGADRTTAYRGETPISGGPRACPVCAATAGERLFDNRMVVCADYDFSTPIMRCGNCDAAYAGRGLSASDLNLYYRTLSKYDIVRSRADISANDQERARLAGEFLKPFLPDIGSALDVGCASGLLLNELRELGVRRVQGIDPAADASRVARSLFDISVTQAQAQSYQEYGNQDLVCLMAVLEHLLEPGWLLRTVGRQLKAGSRLLIEVPDAGAFDRPGDARPLEAFGEFSNEHINFFAIGDIRCLGLSAGLEVEHWRTTRLQSGSADLFVLLRKMPAATELPAAAEGSSATRLKSGEALEHYILRSKQAAEAIENRLESVCRAPVLIYGAGNHTARLLAQSRALRDAEVHAVFDRNHHLQGRSMGDAPIVAPERLPEFARAPIIISTFNARREIHAALSAATSQQLIQLYD